MVVQKGYGTMPSTEEGPKQTLSMATFLSMVRRFAASLQKLDNRVTPLYGAVAASDDDAFGPEIDLAAKDLADKQEAYQDILFLAAVETPNQDFFNIIQNPQGSSLVLSLLAYAYALKAHIKHYGTLDKDLYEKLDAQFQVELEKFKEQYKTHLRTHNIQDQVMASASTRRFDGTVIPGNSMYVPLSEDAITEQVEEIFGQRNDDMLYFLQDFDSYEFLILRLFTRLPEHKVEAILRDILRPASKDETAFKEMLGQLFTFAKTAATPEAFAQFIQAEKPFRLISDYLTSAEIQLYYQRYPLAAPVDIEVKPEQITAYDLADVIQSAVKTSDRSLQDITTSAQAAVDHIHSMLSTFAEIVQRLKAKAISPDEGEALDEEMLETVSKASQELAKIDTIAEYMREAVQEVGAHWQQLQVLTGQSPQQIAASVNVVISRADQATRLANAAADVVDLKSQLPLSLYRADFSNLEKITQALEGAAAKVQSEIPQVSTEVSAPPPTPVSTPERGLRSPSKLSKSPHVVIQDSACESVVGSPLRKRLFPDISSSSSGGSDEGISGSETEIEYDENSSPEWSLEGKAALNTGLKTQSTAPQPVAFKRALQTTKATQQPAASKQALKAQDAAPLAQARRALAVSH